MAFVFIFTVNVSALQINQTSSTNFYVDFSSTMACDYVSFSITNSDGVAYSNLWVTLGGFTNGVLSLAGGDPGQYGLGALQNNQSKPAFFYLQSTNDPGKSGAGVPCRFTIKVFNGFPSAGGVVLTTNNFVLNEVTSGQNMANKVTGLTYSPATNPVVGGIIQMTVQGTTGNVQVGNDMAFTAATFTNWNAGAFQLQSCYIVITDTPNYVLTNTLDATSATHITGNGDSYSAQYWFRAIATTTSNTPVSPVNFLNNGGGTVNHVPQSTLLALSPVLPATNLVTLFALTNAIQLYTNQTATLTIRVTNASFFNVTLDRFVDSLPTGLVYVAGSSKFSGSPIQDPTNINQVLTWSQTYGVLAGSSSDLVFQAIPTNTISSYLTNSCVAFVQNAQIDTTLNTSDNAPAIEVVRGLIAPIAGNVSTNTLENRTLVVTAPGVLANTVEPNGFSATIVSYTQPTNGSVTVNSDGSYTYTPGAFGWGADAFAFMMTNQNGRASTATNSITVTWVNQPPYFTKGTNVSTLENAAAQTIVNWATGMNAGTNDPAQTLSFNVSNNNNSLFSTQPAISSVGTLTFTPAAYASGTATITAVLTDNGGTANGGTNASPPQTFTITIIPVNQAPYFTAGTNVSALENASAQTIVNWATGISAGTNDTGQTVSFNVSNNSNSLFSAQPTISSAGTLTFTPAAYASGTATITAILTDNGGTANGGTNASPPQTFTITIVPVNQPPYFTAGTNVSVLENASALTIASWATGISAGTNDTGQIVSFNVSNNSSSLFSAQPAISPSGTLTFTPAAYAIGTATITAILTDNGGTANGGTNASPPQTFTITIIPVNQPPYFTSGTNVSALENAPAQTIANWATGISAGTNDTGQTVSFNVSNNNNALFSAQPSISPGGTLTFTSATNAIGNAIVTVVLTDNGGTANGGTNASPPQTFTITVVPVNQPPTINPIGNLSLTENWNLQTVNFSGVAAGPPNENSQTLSVTATSGNTSLIPNPTVNYTSPNATGSLVFMPVTNSFGTATVTVIVQDNGGTTNGGVNSVTNTFTVTEQGLTNYWYGGSNLVVNIFDATGSAGTGYSQTNYAGVLSVLSVSTNPFVIAPTGLAADFNSQSNYTWTIATTTRGVIGLLSSNQFTFNTSAFTNDMAGGYFSIALSPDSNAVNLVYVGNHGPIAGPATYSRAFNSLLRVSIPDLLTNYTSDLDNDSRILVGAGPSTNGSVIVTNNLFIQFAPTNNLTESFPYVVIDSRHYRPGDTVLYATNWLTILAIPTVGYANTVTTTNGNLSIKFAGIPNYAYDVQRATNLSGPWITLETTNAPFNGIWLFLDTNPPQPSAFYRTQQH